MKIAVGLSGGVDSAVAALLLKRAGHDVAGVTMSLWREGREIGGLHGSCFGPEEKIQHEKARRLAASLGIDYRVFDCSKQYEEAVLGYFRDERNAGRTPNPCVVCNHLVKFGLLPEAARKELAFEHFATGHYALRVVAPSGRYAIARAPARGKDQSYFLWRLTQAQVELAMFPLGEMGKDEVRAIAREAGLEMAESSDSQDFCRGDCGALIGRAAEAGDVINTKGKILGKHGGYWKYTIGQRQGLGIGGGTPFYVVGLDAERNTVIVGTREEAVKSELSICDINWMGAEPTDAPIKGFVKIRSTGEPVGPVRLERGRIRAPQGLFGVAPGQSAVIYSAEGVILCGGVICQD